MAVPLSLRQGLTVTDDHREEPDNSTGADKPSDRHLLTESGVDRTLIRWFLSLSPRERLQTVQNYAASIQRLRDE